MTPAGACADPEAPAICEPPIAARAHIEHLVPRPTKPPTVLIRRGSTGGIVQMFRVFAAQASPGRRLAAVTAATIAVMGSVTAAPAAAQDLVAAYPFDETTGTVVNDRSGNGKQAS